MSTSPEAGDVSMAMWERCEKSENAYQNKCPKEQNNRPPRLGTIAKNAILPPCAGGPKSHKSDLHGPGSLNLHNQNRHLKDPSSHSPVVERRRDFVPHPTQPGGVRVSGPMPYDPKWVTIPKYTL